MLLIDNLGNIWIALNTSLLLTTPLLVQRGNDQDSCYHLQFHEAMKLIQQIQK